MASKTAAMLRAIREYADVMSKSPDQLLRELPDDKFRLALLSAAELMRTMRDEAVRRGIWDELKGGKVAKPEQNWEHQPRTQPGDRTDA